ncbi:hypothetical protein [Streptococcus minor]|uniref:hypothetical protein n=1 Tax=Streptococcus minor TaxID=229549 RepID=UPI000373BF5F|nr:hypothetical protein [Streptococcus minor]
MANNKYYVSAKNKNLDIGLEVEELNPHMAAIYAYNILSDAYDLTDVFITDVDVVEVRNDK